MRDEWEELERRQNASFDGLGRFVALGAVAVLVFFGWTQLAGNRGPDTAISPPPIKGSQPPSTIIELPRVVEPPAAHYQGPPAPRTGRESYVGVYECVVNGQRVVSDRPCAPNAQPRTLVVDQPDAREVARRRQEQWAAQQATGGAFPTQSSAGSRSTSQAPAAPANEAACDAVDQAIEDLNARMRQGYGAPEGEWLRERWRDLRRQRYELKCGR